MSKDHLNLLDCILYIYRPLYIKGMIKPIDFAAHVVALGSQDDLVKSD